MSPEEKILNGLHNFELQHGAEVILAVESGSRGWGFASKDSDYDIRFVYRYPVKKYLELQGPGLDYEWIEADRDYRGFDIHKFYGLLYSSNMNIIDWLMQDHIYVDKFSKTQKTYLQTIVSTYFDRHRYIEHNYGLTHKNFSKYFVERDKSAVEPTVKRYVYCLKAIMSAMYCARYDKLAPINFYDVFPKVMPQCQLIERTMSNATIENLLRLKKSTKEKHKHVDEVLTYFIEDAIKDRYRATARGQNLLTTKEYYNKLNGHMLNVLGV